MKLIFNDNSELEISNYTSGAFIIQCNNKNEFFDIWSNKMTNENLSKVQITDGVAPILNMENLTFDGAQVVCNTDSTYTCYFYFHGQNYITISEEDMEYAEVGRILLGEEVSE